MRTATLSLLTFLGLLAGAFHGQYVLFDAQNPIDQRHWTFVAGDLLLVRPLALVTLPLVLVCVIGAAGRAKAASRFGLALGATLAWFAIMMIVSSTIGATAASIMRPGATASAATAPDGLAGAAAAFEAAPAVVSGVQMIVDARQDTLSGAALGIVHRAVPNNLIAELSVGRMMGLFVLAMLLGLGLAAIGERGRPALAIIQALQTALLRVARWISWIAPLGVFVLVSNAVGTIGLDGLRGQTQGFALTIAAALAAHAVVLMPMALLVFGRCNPVAFAWRTMRALCIAFVSASSMTALPIALDSVIDDADRRPHRNGRPSRSACSSAAASLVLPLGAMLNLNGTAIFQAAAVVFMCQANGIDVQTADLVVIVITATIAALSTAGVPSAGLVTLIIVITAVNTSLAGRGVEALPTSAIGMLIAIDRALDMCRTAVNVWGNLVAARVISNIVPDELGVTNDELRTTSGDAARRPI